MNCLLNQKPKENYGFIYKYTSPSGKSYIGQTIRSLFERAGKNGIEYESCSIFYRAILKYGFNNFKVKILEEVPINKLNEKEIYYIEYYSTLQPNGYNIKKGGNSEFHGSKRETRICKYDLNGKLITIYKSLQEAARDNATNYQSISAVCRHKRPQHKDFIYRYYDDLSDIVYNKDQRKLGRLTAKLDENGDILEIFSSASRAAMSVGKDKNSARNIRSVCEGKRNHAFGFRWKYLD